LLSTLAPPPSALATAVVLADALPESCEIAVVFEATCWLVAYNWLPLTASVLEAERMPAATPVTVRLPAVPATLMTVPPVVAPMLIAWVVASCWTSPTVPLPSWVCSVAMSPVLVVTCVLSAPRAPPTLE
jgi:hypothetical protein